MLECIFGALALAAKEDAAIGKLTLHLIFMSEL